MQKSHKTPSTPGAPRTGSYPSKHIQPRNASQIVETHVRHCLGRPSAKDKANKAFDLFKEMFEDKYPKAVNNLKQDRAELMAFYDFPTQHWQGLCTTNPIESTFATIRHHTNRAKGCLTDKRMLHMLFNRRMRPNWCRLRGFGFLAEVISEVRLVVGVEARGKAKQKAA